MGRTGMPCHCGGVIRASGAEWRTGRTFAAAAPFRFKVALAIGAGGNFGRPLINRRPRGYLGGVRWGGGVR